MHIPENALIIDCVTRWNSTYDMYKRLLQQRLAVYAVLHDEKVTRLSDARTLDLSDSQWQIMQSMAPVLKPLYMATRLVCSEAFPTSTTRELEDRHTGINIAKEISAICDEFKIKHNTIAGLVSDNASNMVFLCHITDVLGTLCSSR
ncbi:hypothetical protein KUTeg_003739 [Tegillarca granosa]|uniref:Transposase n=1 Tax=Tegillarca granosa TaxID=220873 RepID=A0ABQ9FMZ6_TEGGR|nr:hypothetical protein KUTeg_003739 [Tegillarca granosa]